MAGNEKKDCKSIPEKPLIGLQPRISHDKTRKIEIMLAMTRYIDYNYKFPPEWIDELNDLNNLTY
jgi:hypothetical protein